MDRRASPDNHIRRVMDAGLPGLEDDLFFEERVLHRIRTLNRRSTRSRRKASRGLAFGLALVLMTVAAVTVSLTCGKERPPVVAASLEGESGELGFADVPTTRLASGHTCKWALQRIQPDCYRYYDGEYDMLCAQFVAVCGICGKTNGLSYAHILEEPLVEHDWFAPKNYHIEGTTLHVFYKECTRCRARWEPMEVPCAGLNDIHVNPRYYWKQ